MRYLYILRGLPGSGKSTFIKNSGLMGLEPYTLSSDEYRLKIVSPSPNVHGDWTIPQAQNARAWKRLMEDLECRMKFGETTIVDATHITKDSVARYKALAKKYFYRLAVIEFKTDVETCIKRDMARGEFKSVGESVIRKMADKWQEVGNSILHIKPEDLFEHMKFMPLDFNKYNKVHVIGDIHGCYTALMHTLKNADKDNDAFVFVGDYFDRGIENDKMFEYILENIDKPNYYFLKGNHEQRILQYLIGEDISHTQFYKHTLPQLKCSDKELKKLYRGLLPCARFIFNEKDYIITHAGIPSPNFDKFVGEPYFVNGVGQYNDMLKVCKSFSSLVNGQTIQIFGHRNHDNINDIVIKDNCFNVCGFPEYGGDLKSVTITRNGHAFKRSTNVIISEEQYYKALEKYPHRFRIDNVESLVGAFRHNKYVTEHEFGDISSFKFTKEAFYDSHWNNISTRARGIFINTKTNNIVARSYDKFFLLDQYEHCALDKFKAPFTVYRKYDGFLGIIGVDNGKLVFCSKSTIAPDGDYANLFESKIRPYIKDEELLTLYLSINKISLVFECIAPKEDEHLIKYDEDMVVLLDVINNTIEYSKPFDYEEYRGILNDFFYSNIKLKEKVCENVFDKQELAIFKELSGEGFVFEDANGKMFKLKTYEYEAKKILRNIKDTYMGIKGKAGEHKINYPKDSKIRDRYCQHYADCVVDEVVRGTKEIIRALNNL